MRNLKAKKENMFIFYLLSFTWGIIYTLLGLFVLFIIRLFFNRKIQEYRVVAGRIAIITKRNLPGAFELGIAYIADKNTLTSFRLHAHEIGHSIQNAWFGPFFLIFVIVGAIRFNLWTTLRARHYKKYNKELQYDDLWIEGQATSLGIQYCGERIKRDLHL